MRLIIQQRKCLTILVSREGSRKLPRKFERVCGDRNNETAISNAEHSCRGNEIEFAIKSSLQ